MPSDVIDYLAADFRQDLLEVFGEDLHLAFVFGGFAKGYAGPSHDIDIFISLECLDPERIKRFRDLYFALHEKFDLSPDHNDPGEICTVLELHARLKYAKTIKIEPVIESYLDYETIVWVDALASPKIVVMDDTQRLTELAREANALFSFWRERLEAMASPVLKAANKSTTELFEALVRYEKRDPSCRLLTGLESNHQSLPHAI